MTDLNFFAVLAAAVAAFVVSSTYYSVVEHLRVSWALATVTAAAGPPPAWKIGVELTRSAVVATAASVLVAALGVSSWTAAVPLGLAAWVAFPVTLLVGSMMWENVPAATAAIHAGDWLLKLLVVAAIVVVWQ